MTTSFKQAATAPLVVAPTGPGGLLATSGRAVAARRRRARRKAAGEKVEIVGNLCRVGGQFAPCDAGGGSSSNGGAAPATDTPSPTAGAVPTTSMPIPEDSATRVANREQVAGTIGMSNDDMESLSEVVGEGEPVAVNPESGQRLAEAGLITIDENGNAVPTDKGKALADAAAAGDSDTAKQIVSGGTPPSPGSLPSPSGSSSASPAPAPPSTGGAAATSATPSSATPKPTGGGGGPSKDAQEEARRRTEGRLQRWANLIGRPVGGIAPATKAAMRPSRKKLYWRTYRAERGRGLDRGAARRSAGLALRRDTAAKLARAYGRALGLTGKSFAVVKDARGRDRWIMVSSTAYRDRDEEIVSAKALRGAVALGDATRQRGPLRLWHVPGWDIGDCDFQATLMDDRHLLESGTFRDPAWARALAPIAAQLGGTIGFTHPASEPNGGVFDHIAIFERSLAPRDRVSNHFTRFAVKEAARSMLTREKETWLRREFGELAEALIAQVAATDKTAQQAGVAFKEQKEAPADLVINGVIYKAAMPPAEMAEAAATEMADAMAEEAGEEADASESLLTPQEMEALAAMVAEKIIGMLDGISAKMSAIDEEMKMRGYARTKEALMAELGPRLDRIDAALAEFASEQPRTVYRASQDAATAKKEAPAAAGAEQDPLTAWVFANNHGQFPWTAAAPAIHGAPHNE